MPHAAVNGQRLLYTDSGEGEGVIVFSHGYLLNQTMFEAQIAALRDSWRCIAWDQRGHGETMTTPDPFTYWDSASDLLGLLDHLGVDHAVLAGMSQGGYVSLRAALTAPDRVRGLVLIATQPGIDDPAKAAAYDQMKNAWVAPGGPPQELVDAVSAMIIGPRHPDAERWIEPAKRMPPATANQIYSTLSSREDDVTPRLAELTMPVLVIHGEHDPVIELQTARSFADTLPEGELVVIPGAGHGTSLTHADAVNAAIGEFLARL